MRMLCQCIFFLMIVDALGQTDQTTLTVVDYEQLKPMYEQIDAHAENLFIK